MRRVLYPWLTNSRSVAIFFWCFHHARLRGSRAEHGLGGVREVGLRQPLGGLRKAEAVAERVAHLNGVAEAGRRILGERTREERVEHERGLRQKRAYGRWCRLDLVLADEELAAIGGEGGAAGEHLVQDDRGGVQVAPSVDGTGKHLLGRHVRAGPEPELGGGVGRGRVGEAGDAEVSELHQTVAADEDVRGLHVAVHDPERVYPGECPEQLLEVVPRAEQRHPGQSGWTCELRPRDVARDDRVEGLAVDVLHGEDQAALVLEEVLVRHDVRVRQSAHGSGLAQEQLSHDLVLRRGGAQDLEREQLGLVAQRRPGRVEHPRPPDHAHPAFAEARVHDDPRVATVDRDARREALA